MTLAFYSVNNKLGYCRGTFNTVADKPKEILEMLKKLPENEVRFYNTETYSWGTKEAGMESFEEDYNDEILDGGWWCVVIQ